MGEYGENQQRAERNHFVIEFVRFILLPDAKGKSLDPFLFPSWAFAAGVFYLLSAKDLSRAWGVILFFVLFYQFLISVTVAFLLRRILAYVFDVYPSLAWVIFACAALMLMLVGGAIRYHQAKKSEAIETAAAAVKESRLRSAEESSRAERVAAQAERDARVALIERWRLARTNAIETWRKNMVAHGALGDRGVTPPMLEINDDGKRINVTNRAADAACVLLTRIAKNESGRIERCAVAGSQCVVIPAGETRRLATLLAGNPDSCLSGQLEYRVGNVDHPEPSWWSQSAFAEYAESADVEVVRRWSDERLLAEVERLEALVQSHTRVER